jgi:hypothetical protein
MKIQRIQEQQTHATPKSDPRKCSRACIFDGVGFTSRRRVFIENASFILAATWLLPWALRESRSVVIAGEV